MSVLAGITSPEDLRRITPDKLPGLASEIRDFLVHKVSKTGGHLGPNLGVVELTIALHRVFTSPYEPIIFDTGHQAYVHKMLTGRQAGFDQLRRRGGLSGYPNPTESEHDWTESSHASASLSYVDGLSKAFEVRGERRAVVGVIGDGALTGGMAWEALNNIASGKRPVVVVVNDNGRSYSPTIGGIATKLAALRLQPKYERALLRMKNAVSATPVVGPAVYDALHGIKAGIKDILAPQGMFEDLGLKYVGPVDGHDEAAVERALQLAKDFDGPVLVHCVTHKGFGYPPAENHEEDQFHSPAAFDWETGQSLAVATTTWTNVFSEELVKIGTDRSDVVAITAAMLYPTGLAAFATAFPNRAFDVGIAEQHALTSAAGMAMGGLHPVVALYATFLNRAFDQFVMDIALHKQPVTIVLDRAGVTGTDGPSHNGMWDLALLAGVPGVRIAAPRDGQRLRQQLRQAVDVSDGPTVLRFSKGSEIAPIAAIETHEGYEVLRRGAWNDVLLIAVGPMAAVALDVADRAADQGVAVTVVDPGWVIPVSAGLRELTRDYKLVVTVEDGLRVGGVGSVIAQCMSDADIDVPVHNVGIPNEFLQHGSRDQVLADCGLTAQAIARNVVAWSSRLDGQTTHPNPSAPANVRDETSDLGDTQ